ncbi:MAG TPA: hypothetical protein VFS40_09250 [Gemmatimonadales bacterium]|nr:hypothetical protein [Gemmatimonadales bacterium]
MMSPDAIKDLVDRDFTSMRAERRHNPDGWSFFVHDVRRHAKPTRVARALRPWPGSPTFVELAMTSRLTGAEHEVEADSADQVAALLQEELRLYAEHFGGPAA